MICSRCGNKVKTGYVEVEGETICSECYASIMQENTTEADYYKSIYKVLEKKEEGMFGNIGSKIKSLAKTMSMLGIIVSCVIGISMFIMSMSVWNSGGLVLSGIIIMIVGALVSWIGSFIIYGFGELVENSSLQAKLMVEKEIKKKVSADQ